jgi:hypothetical protein
MSIVYKPGVRAHTPYLPFPAVFEKGEDFRNLLLAKRTLLLACVCRLSYYMLLTIVAVINGGLAALHSPEFLSSLRRTRKELLNELLKRQSPRINRKLSRSVLNTSN